MECFARLFRQDAIADVDLVIRSLGASDDAAPDPKRARGGTSAAAADTAAWDQLQLAALPAHKIILFNSEYFEAQVGSKNLVSGMWLTSRKYITVRTCQSSVARAACVAERHLLILPSCC
jgi:hypothetical protein